MRFIEKLGPLFYKRKIIMNQNGKKPNNPPHSFTPTERERDVNRISRVFVHIAFLGLCHVRHHFNEVLTTIVVV